MNDTDRAYNDLQALPTLTDELTRCLTEKPPIDNGDRGGVPGSRPPLRLDVLHLTDTRHKPDWHGTDPREGGATNRYGVLVTLESWTRVLTEEYRATGGNLELADTPTIHTETRTLSRHWNWITTQQWANECAGDITTITSHVRNALGTGKQLQLRCPNCHDHMRLQDGSRWAACDSGHQTDVGDLATKQRRRPPETTRTLATEYGITANKIWQWKNRDKLTPTGTIGNATFWLPWDVFTLTHPDIVEALETKAAA